MPVTGFGLVAPPVNHFCGMASQAVVAVTAKQVRDAAVLLPPLQPGDDQRPVSVYGGDEIVRLCVQLAHPVMYKTASFSMQIAGDVSGSLGFYFYARRAAREGAPKKRALEENKDVRDSMVRVDIREAPRKVKFPLKSSQYYMVHGRVFLNHANEAAGSPVSTAAVSVVHCRPVVDPNELTHHFLECMAHHVLHVGKPPEEGGGAAAAAAADDGDDACFFVGGGGDEDAASDML